MCSRSGNCLDIYSPASGDLWDQGFLFVCFLARLSFGRTSCTSRRLQHPIAGNGFPGTGCLVAEWKPWQQEAGRIFPSPRRKGSLFLGPEPSYSLVLHFAVNFNAGEPVLRALGPSLGGLISDLRPFFCLQKGQLVAPFEAVCSHKTWSLAPD